MVLPLGLTPSFWSPPLAVFERACKPDGERCPRSRVVEQPGVQREAAGIRKIRERVVVRIIGLLHVTGSQEGHPQAFAPCSVEATEIVTAGCCSVGKKRQVRLLCRHFRDEIDETGDGIATVERRSWAFDDLYLLKVQRRHLQQREATREAAIEREAILQDLRIAAVEALNAN